MNSPRNGAWPLPELLHSPETAHDRPDAVVRLVDATPRDAHTIIRAVISRDDATLLAIHDLPRHRETYMVQLVRLAWPLARTEMLAIGSSSNEQCGGVQTFMYGEMPIPESAVFAAHAQECDACRAIIETSLVEIQEALAEDEAAILADFDGPSFGVEDHPFLDEAESTGTRRALRDVQSLPEPNLDNRGPTTWPELADAPTAPVSVDPPRLPRPPEPQLRAITMSAPWSPSPSREAAAPQMPAIARPSPDRQRMPPKQVSPRRRPRNSIVAAGFAVLVIFTITLDNAGSIIKRLLLRGETVSESVTAAPRLAPESVPTRSASTDAAPHATDPVVPSGPAPRPQPTQPAPQDVRRRQPRRPPRQPTERDLLLARVHSSLSSPPAWFGACIATLYQSARASDLTITAESSRQTISELRWSFDVVGERALLQRFQADLPLECSPQPGRGRVLFPTTIRRAGYSVASPWLLQVVVYARR